MADFCDHDNGYCGSKNASYFSTVFAIENLLRELATNPSLDVTRYELHARQVKGKWLE